MKVMMSSLIYLADEEQNEESQVKITRNGPCTLQNQNLQVQVSDAGEITQINNLNKTISINLSNQGFYWYQGI